MTDAAPTAGVAFVPQLDRAALAARADNPLAASARLPLEEIHRESAIPTHWITPRQCSILHTDFEGIMRRIVHRYPGSGALSFCRTVGPRQRSLLEVLSYNTFMTRIRIWGYSRITRWNLTCTETRYSFV